jgi:pyruvate dehydrogenase E2 component (dihydrolipoamide acetyltransferase)
MFDVENFQPIINPPSSVTLAVSTALATPVVKEGMILIGRVMKLTLSCDHRIIDGVAAAKFLAELKKILEGAPELLAGE